jgi:ankyrin repeat protein
LTRIVSRFAIQYDNLCMVKFLLSRNVDVNTTHPMNGDSPLEFAAYSASIPVIEALLDAGAVLRGRSALQSAVEKPRTVVYLLDEGADINEIPENPSISQNQRDRGVKNPLCNAAYRGEHEAVRLLLELGADTAIRDTLGRSALDLAEMESHGLCVSILKEYINDSDT